MPMMSSIYTSADLSEMNMYRMSMERSVMLILGQFWFTCTTYVLVRSLIAYYLEVSVDLLKWRELLRNAISDVMYNARGLPEQEELVLDMQRSVKNSVSTILKEYMILLDPEFRQRCFAIVKNSGSTVDTSGTAADTDVFAFAMLIQNLIFREINQNCMLDSKSPALSEDTKPHNQVTVSISNNKPSLTSVQNLGYRRQFTYPRLRICDFSFERTFDSKKLKKEFTRPPAYIAPEIIHTGSTTAQTDAVALLLTNHKCAQNMNVGIIVLHNLKSRPRKPQYCASPLSKPFWNRCDSESITDGRTEKSSSEPIKAMYFQPHRGAAISELPATPPNRKVPVFFSAGGGGDKEKGDHKFIKKENFDDPDTFLLKFILVSSCLMLCFLPLFTENNETNTIAGVGNMLFLKLHFSRSSWIFYAFTGSLMLAAPTSLLSLETTALNPKLATRCGNLAVISMVAALTLLFISTVSFLCAIIIKAEIYSPFTI